MASIPTGDLDGRHRRTLAAPCGAGLLQKYRDRLASVVTVLARPTHFGCVVRPDILRISLTRWAQPATGRVAPVVSRY